MIGLFPMTSAWSRQTIRRADTQCAREETLSVHIPQARLDAARFDGMTILVLDPSGQEWPVFLPPNYVEGFRLASSGQVLPSQQPQHPFVTPQPRPYEPSRERLIAPCPAGTTKQSDGNCLSQGSYAGYPQN